MRRRNIATTLVFTLIVLALAALAQGASLADSVLSTRVEAFRAGADVLLTVTLDIQEEWYTYADKPGGLGKPTRLTGFTADESPLAEFYPVGISKQDSFDPKVTVNTYKSGTRLFALIPAATAASFPVRMELDLLLCHPTKCVPARRTLSLPAPASGIAGLPDATAQPWWTEYAALKRPVAKEPVAPPAVTSPEDKAPEVWDFTPRYLRPGLEVAGLLSAVLMGLVAGLILNVMPCVLPVVSLKLSALLNAAAEDEAERVRRFREHNAFFVLGVLAFFLFLALVLGGTGQAWGALFQKQWLVLAVAGVVLALALSLFGLFHLPVIDLKFGTRSASPRTQAFFTGCLTTLLATPCSGPFLGGVLSWALIQGPVIIAAVFVAIGLGMSLPYLLLIARPGLSRFLPRSGPWIEYVEKGVAFFLVGTAFYLAAIALGGDALRYLAPLWGLLFGGWIWLRTRMARPVAAWTFRLAAVVLFAALLAWTAPTTVAPTDWERFDPATFSERLGKEKLFLDFTADWCPTCKALEATVLTPVNVARWRDQYGVTFVKVDLTERDVEGEALLRALGSASIPTAALFSPGPESSSPLVLRDLFTASQLETILKSWD
ncbi:cytochrome c biogenesis protein CcdA [Pseudodesulfovibrio sp.]|uniref:protein-disulfide reductase DsbD family protein n=1 Tax=Pseudodesulfovibrio sp. TaxID=2035812 RepID=UPI00261E4C05|nr:cytochrome c biogenesis protein CcdA [Pseudodesulfovibrio sp.]MDD3310688.1 cytochrome c biogenesis protein CcdA [Pseudodesulfovibrio sp.]